MYLYLQIIGSALSFTSLCRYLLEFLIAGKIPKPQKTANDIVLGLLGTFFYSYSWFSADMKQLLFVSSYIALKYI